MLLIVILSLSNTRVRDIYKLHFNVVPARNTKLILYVQSEATRVVEVALLLTFYLHIYFQ